eukprot:11585737-Alexandrium_andersonii.AAC.1
MASKESTTIGPRAPQIGTELEDSRNPRAKSNLRTPERLCNWVAGRIQQHPRRQRSALVAGAPEVSLHGTPESDTTLG